MAGERLLGIDLGTTAVKAGVVGCDGTVHGMARVPSRTTRGPGGVVEQEAGLWLSLVHEVLDGMDVSDVAGLALCSQVNTHVFVDAKGMPLAPAFLWQDTRARAEAAELDARLTDAEKIALLGAPMPIDASHVLPRMLWMARHRPVIWAETAHVLLPKDFVLLHLTGRVVTDPLSTIGCTGPDLAYADALFDLVPGSRARMAPLAGVAEIIGAAKDGPAQGLPVVNGSMDAWAGLVGTGGAQEGRAMYLSGTSEILGISARNVVPTPGAIVFPEASGLRLHAAPTQHGGDAQLWAADALGLSLSDLSARAADATPGPQTPLFLPQLQGERAPIWTPHLRGAFLGLDRSSGPGDLARAVFEGVAMQAFWAFETLEASSGVSPAEIYCGGGGFRSEIWSQIRADVFGRPLHVMSAGEAGVMGAATLAGLGLGLFSDFATAQSALVRFDRTFVPDDQARERYQALSSIYRTAVSANDAVAKDLAGLWAEKT